MPPERWHLQSARDRATSSWEPLSEAGCIKKPAGSVLLEETELQRSLRSDDLKEPGVTGTPDLG